MNFGRLIRTVRHLKPSQVYWRGRYLLERRLGLGRLPPAPAGVSTWDREARARLRGCAERWGALDTQAPARAAAFRAGQFRFLNDAADFSAGIDWISASRARLWRYQLHYFDCAKELALSPAPGDAARVKAWMLDWIAKNPPVTDVAWDAFTISARLMNWALAAAALGIDDDAVRMSFLWQARYLSTHLERDVLANHLLKNACALCVAGALLDASLLPQGLALLRAQLEEQILPDGGHYERAPMYHALVLEDLLVVQAALGAHDDFLAPYIARMAAFLDGILHPDGEIPFFGDSVLGESRTPHVLLALAGHTRAAGPPSASFPDSGFYVLRDAPQRMHLIVKAGAPGPAYQPGHAHADFGSYELSLDGARAIVNCGVHGYADSPHRAYCRSEAAHSTFELVGMPQLEAWGAFRVGRRYGVSDRPVYTANGITARLANDAGAAVEACREVQCTAAGTITVSSHGPAGHALIDRIHFAPGLTVRPADGKFHVLRGDQHLLTIQDLASKDSATRWRIEDGPYFPEFGVTQPIVSLIADAGPRASHTAYEIRLP